MGTVSESIKTECREFSYIASELHKRKIETIIDSERGVIQLRGEGTGKTYDNDKYNGYISIRKAP